MYSPLEKSTTMIHTKAIKEFNDWEGTYKKVLIRDEKISGAVLFGNTKEGNKLLSMINNRRMFPNTLNHGKR